MVDSKIMKLLSECGFLQEPDFFRFFYGNVGSFSGDDLFSDSGWGESEFSDYVVGDAHHVFVCGGGLG